MEEFLPYFERELGILRSGFPRFAASYPKLAAELQIVGETSVDPHIERLIQSAALLNARTMKLLDDDYAHMTKALLSVLYPHYLRPFPSCSIARVDFSAQADTLATSTTIARGSALKAPESQGVVCQFRTAYEVGVGPVTLPQVRFHPIIEAPAAIRLPVGIGAGISIVIDHLSVAAQAGQSVQRSLRVYIDGEPSFCAALRDTLFMRTVCAYVERPGAGQWSLLDRVPLKPVGFAHEDALIPFRSSEHAAYRLLTEYFAFPEKFNFFDIDLATLATYLAPGDERLILHLALPSLRGDADIGRVLAPLSSKHLVLGCTPVVNLFPRGATPIRVTHAASEYGLTVSGAKPCAHEIYSIDSVHMLREGPGASGATEFHPFYSLRHGQGRGKNGCYWMARRDDELVARSPGHEMKIAFIDADFNPIMAETGIASIELTCSNRDLPTRLPYGAPGGDLCAEGAAASYPIRLLRKLSPARRFRSGQGGHWRLISHLALNHRSLTNDGLDALVEMLTLYDLPQSPVSQRQIGGIVGLAHRPATARLRDRRGVSLAHGVEVRLTLDEAAFAGSGIHAFAQVIDHFLGLSVHLNSFIQLTVLSEKTGQELLRCLPRNGDLNLV